LFDIYFSSLTAKIRKGTNESKTYTRPDFTTLITHVDQYDTLVLLNNEASVVWEMHKEQYYRFHETWKELANAIKIGPRGKLKQQNRNNATLVKTADIYHYVTVAPFQDVPPPKAPPYTNPPPQHTRFEFTCTLRIRQWAPAAEEMIVNATAGETHVRDVNAYPTCPETGRPSDFPLVFCGCMRCGDPNHSFKD
jgi:hypothetical protein